MRISSQIGASPSTKRALFAALLAATLGTFSLVATGCGGKKPPPPVEPSAGETNLDAGVDAEPPPPPPPPKSLFERIGGQDGVAKLVDSLLQNVNADAKLKKQFAKLKGDKLDSFKKNLSDQICEGAGGPCKYAGKDPKSPRDVSISDAQWDAFVQDLQAAMDENKVSDDDKNELMALVAPLRNDIVGSAGKHHK